MNLLGNVITQYVTRTRECSPVLSRLTWAERRDTWLHTQPCCKMGRASKSWRTLTIFIGLHGSSLAKNTGIDLQTYQWKPYISQSCSCVCCLPFQEMMRARRFWIPQKPTEAVTPETDHKQPPAEFRDQSQAIIRGLKPFCMHALHCMTLTPPLLLESQVFLLYCLTLLIIYAPSKIYFKDVYLFIKTSLFHVNPLHFTALHVQYTVCESSFLSPCVPEM